MKLIIWTSIVSLSMISAQGFTLNQSFREPKNILFGTVGGGSSHINWVLNILDELSSRGHNVTFVTHDNEVKYGKKYPHFTTKSIGPNDVDLSVAGNRLRFIENSHFFREIYNDIHKNYDSKMNSYRAILESTKFDVLLCDHFTVPCVDIAKNLNVPMIITTALAISQDASAPYLNNFLESNDTTSEYMSFYDRIYAKLAQPFSIVMEIKSVIDETKKKKAELGWLPTEGIPAFEDNWKDSIKLVNNLFGFEPARPLGPLVELIGPIMSTEYPDLTPKEQAFLESHHKVAYVAFGQSAKIERKEIELILTALIDAIEKGALDGFIWATRDSKESFPETIVSFSEKTYSVSHMFDGLNENTLFLQWAPQMAILSHPSTTLFVSHGGLASLHEATYAGVRTALYPFYGDQPSNSYMMRTQNLGVQLSLDMQQPEFSKLIEQIALDENGTYQKNVDRFKAMVQIHAKHGTLRGADLVEEVIFTNNNGKLTHRYEASRNMSFFKARNLDLYGFVLFVFLALIGASIYSINYLYNSTLDVLDSQKIKNQSKYRLVDQDNKKTK